MDQSTALALNESIRILEGRIESMQTQLNAFAATLEAVGDVRIAMDAYKKQVDGVKELCASHIAVEFAALAEQVEEANAKLDGRNKSAPTKRNMTDADALRVLNGDMKDLQHKEAANGIGLTYAQVYSCRGGFTFKHVIHELEKAGWKNPWEKSSKK